MGPIAIPGKRIKGLSLNSGDLKRYFSNEENLTLDPVMIPVYTPEETKPEPETTEQNNLNTL